MLLQEPVGRDQGVGALASHTIADEAMMRPTQGRAAVLLVEDERVTRRTLSTLLSRSGYPTQAVGSGEEALSEVAKGRAPGLAVVDLDLPGMNGLELIKRLRSIAPSLTPVLVTASGAESVLRAVRSAGIGYLRKPIDFDQLLHVLDEVRNGPRPRLSSDAFSHPA